MTLDPPRAPLSWSGCRDWNPAPPLTTSYEICTTSRRLSRRRRSSGSDVSTLAPRLRAATATEASMTSAVVCPWLLRRADPLLQPAGRPRRPHRKSAIRGAESILLDDFHLAMLGQRLLRERGGGRDGRMHGRRSRRSVDRSAQIRPVLPCPGPRWSSAECSVRGLHFRGGKRATTRLGNHLLEHHRQVVEFQLFFQCSNHIGTHT